MTSSQPHMPRLALAVACLCALVPTALAQRFAFVSTRAPEAQAGAFDRPWQSEVYFYRDGTEQRLTATPHASEYDPAPSPGGRFVAFVAHDHSHEADGWDAWGWYLAVVETLTGREVARWDLPRTVGMTRPAGGFQTAWVGDAAVLAQVPAATGDWEVHAFDLGSGAARRVTDGYGAVVAPGGARLATSRADGVHVVDLAGGSETRAFAGAGMPLAWWRDGLFVATESGLLLVDVATGANETVVAAALVTELRVDPSGERYAYVRLHPAGAGSDVVVVEGGVEVPVWRLDGWVTGLDWLEPGLMAFAVTEPGGDVYVQVSDLLGGGFRVASAGEDHGPRGVPRP